MRAYGDGVRITWFEFGFWLFAAALPIGLVVALVAPVKFMHVLGAVVIGMSLIGLWVCALGLQLVHPQRWVALKASARRLASTTG
jgi:hypothetical protein